MIELNYFLECFLFVGMMLVVSVFEVCVNGFEIFWWGGGLFEVYLFDYYGNIVSCLIFNYMLFGVLFFNEFEVDV